MHNLKLKAVFSQRRAVYTEVKSKTKSIIHHSSIVFKYTIFHS
jgi:hypothetical protein